MAGAVGLMSGRWVLLHLARQGKRQMEKAGPAAEDQEFQDFIPNV